jgi:hypothetical protein
MTVLWDVSTGSLQGVNGAIRFLGAVFMMLLVEYLSTASFPDTWKGDRFIRLLWGVFP